MTLGESDLLLKCSVFLKSAIIALREAGRSTLQALADELNRLNIPTRRGGRWFPQSVKNVLARSV